MNMPEPIPFRPEWSKPDPRFLRPELPAPPALPLEDVMGRSWANIIRCAAEAKASPPDYVLAALLATAGSVIGNARWVSPWAGWSEPPFLWTMVIGTPSSGKSPGLNAVLSPLKQLELDLKQEAEAPLTDWREKAEIAKLVEQTWKEQVKAALREGKEPQAKPEAADPGPEPVMPRAYVIDGTVEKLADLLSVRPRGFLQFRDELAGWLQGMTRYSGGGSDRPFWLEAYGGGSYTVERIGRGSIAVERLALGVVGGIQPDRLRTLLLKSDDDGLLARFLPFWPHPAPICRPNRAFDDAAILKPLKRLWSLEMMVDECGTVRPCYVTLSEPAKALLDNFRQQVREWEDGTEGLLLSFLGKLPGMCIRLSLILAYLDWAVANEREPVEVGVTHFGRAAHLLQAYVLPMARRSYAAASIPNAEKSAYRLIDLIREQRLERFTTREIQRFERSGLAKAADLNPALKLLEEAEIVRPVEVPAPPQGGRPSRIYNVNPAVHGG